jgi:hypothetical protein
VDPATVARNTTLIRGSIEDLFSNILLLVHFRSLNLFIAHKQILTKFIFIL